MKVQEFAKALRELWDERTNIHRRLLDLAADIEMYGVVGYPEVELINYLIYESESMTLSLKNALLAALQDIER